MSEDNLTPDTTVEETATSKQKTKARISKRGIVENIVLRQESDASAGLVFNHLQDIVLKSIESMMALSPDSTLKVLEMIKDQILPEAEKSAEDYKKAVIETFETLEVEVMEDADFEAFMKERELPESQETEEGTEKEINTQETRQPLGLVKTQWEQ